MDVSQPSLTRSLKAIEKTLGVQLIERRGVAPTIFGEIVLRKGDQVLDALSEIVREIDLAQGLGMGKLTIAAGPYAADISGMRAVAVLAARHPRLAVDLRFADWSRIAADVLESRLDLGLADITQAVREPDLQTDAVRTSQVNFFCASGHPLARRKRLALDDLLEFPWAGPSIPGRVRAVLPQVDKAFGYFDDSTDRFHPRILVETFSAAKNIVLGSQAIGAAVKGQIDPEIRAGRLVTLPIDTPRLSLNYGFITKRGRMLSPAAKAFMQIVREIENGIPQ